MTLLDNIKDLEKKVQLIDIESDAYNIRFNIVSATISKCLPSIPIQSHKDLFKRIEFHRQLSLIEEQQIFEGETAQFDTLDFPIQNDGQCAIYCLWHTGSFKSINYLLSKNNIDFALVVSKTAYESITAKKQTEYDQVTIIDAENKYAFFQMIRSLKAGKSVVIYNDGNSGSGKSKADNTHNCDVRFLNTILSVRSGICHLSYLSKVPIIPITSYRDINGSPIFKKGEAISPLMHENKELYVKETLQKLYTSFSSTITQYPEQWEAWFYLHKQISSVIEPAPASISENKIWFNSAAFAIFSQKNQYFLFNRLTYQSYPISYEIFDLLRNIRDTKLIPDDSISEIIASLIKKNILLSSP